MTQNTDSTMFKFFESYSELLKKTSGYKLYVKLSNCWCINATKKAVKEVADSMKRNGVPFTGSISFTSGGKKTVQITINGKPS